MPKSGEDVPLQAKVVKTRSVGEHNSVDGSGRLDSPCQEQGSVRGLRQGSPCAQSTWWGRDAREIIAGRLRMWRSRRIWNERASEAWDYSKDRLCVEMWKSSCSKDSMVSIRCAASRNADWSDGFKRTKSANHIAPGGVGIRGPRSETPPKVTIFKIL